MSERKWCGHSVKGQMPMRLLHLVLSLCACVSVCVCASGSVCVCVCAQSDTGTKHIFIPQRHSECISLSTPPVGIEDI